MPGGKKNIALSALRREFMSLAGQQAAVPDQRGPGQMVYEDPYHKVYKLGVRVRDVEKEYLVIECGSRAGVLPVKGDKILLVRQYRLLVNGLSWEIPGGKIEAGETPQEAAIRECFEETGVECRRLQALAGYHPGMDTFCNPTYLYFSDDLREGEASAGHCGETVEKAWFPLAAALDMILSMQIVDAFTMIGVMAYRIRTGMFSSVNHRQGGT